MTVNSYSMWWFVIWGINGWQTNNKLVSQIIYLYIKWLLTVVDYEIALFILICLKSLKKLGKSCNLIKNHVNVIAKIGYTFRNFKSSSLSLSLYQLTQTLN